MEEKKAFLIINAIVNKENLAAVKLYLENMKPVFGKNGGRPVGRYKTIERLAGEDSPEMTAIIEFTDADTIRKMVQSEDFTSLADLRSKAFTKLNLMISES